MYSRVTGSGIGTKPGGVTGGGRSVGLKVAKLRSVQFGSFGNDLSKYIREGVLGVGVSGSSSSVQSSLSGGRATSEGGTFAKLGVVAATGDSKVTGDSSRVSLGIGVDRLDLVRVVYDLEEVVGLNSVFTLSRGGEVVSRGNYFYRIRIRSIGRWISDLRSCSTVTDWPGARTVKELSEPSRIAV